MTLHHISAGSRGGGGRERGLGSASAWVRGDPRRTHGPQSCVRRGAVGRGALGRGTPPVAACRSGWGRLPRACPPRPAIEERKQVFMTPLSVRQRVQRRGQTRAARGRECFCKSILFLQVPPFPRRVTNLGTFQVTGGVSGQLGSWPLSCDASFPLGGGKGGGKAPPRVLSSPAHAAPASPAARAPCSRFQLVRGMDETCPLCTGGRGEGACSSRAM